VSKRKKERKEGGRENTLIDTAEHRIDNASFNHSSVGYHHPVEKENEGERTPGRETGNASCVCICVYVFHQFIPVDWKLSLNICADTLNLAETMPVASRS